MTLGRRPQRDGPLKSWVEGTVRREDLNGGGEMNEKETEELVGKEFGRGTTAEGVSGEYSGKERRTL